ncbi:enoyl-CoA delta isomerase 2-like isoform X2 [Achroia grisella]|uniref:enoyl-CoA delta isomerase 2-like isoform X2 n=1 Tax=Achroia grisella TaxID=688607 RepID=UPI0027D1F2D3|nr:enoyl-CoA delta isomerase 2-like isoform X2 [Achroia grisella]
MSLTDTIIQYKKENILVICFNKPKKKNALDSNMYQEVKEIFQKATTDDEIAAVVITGTGNFYSSGNDLSYIPKTDEEYLEFMKVLRNFIRAFIVFPKILIALVNGPAVGIAATSLPLCDLVLASDNALEMLLFNYKLSAKEALECGFINYVYKHDEFQIKAWDKIKEITELPTIPMFATKKLIRHQIQEQLLKINDKELQKIIQIKTNRLMKFENENSKL